MQFCRAAKLAEILFNLDVCSFDLKPLFNFLPMKSEETEEMTDLPSAVYIDLSPNSIVT